MLLAPNGRFQCKENANILQNADAWEMPQIIYIWFLFYSVGHFGEIADENTIHNHHQFVCISFAGKPNIPFMIIAHGMYLKCTQRASKYRKETDKREGGRAKASA